MPENRKYLDFLYEVECDVYKFGIQKLMARNFLEPFGGERRLTISKMCLKREDVKEFSSLKVVYLMY